MKKFKVIVLSHYETEVVVEANTEDEAFEIVEDKIDNGEVYPDITTDFAEQEAIEAEEVAD